MLKNRFYLQPFLKLITISSLTLLISFTTSCEKENAKSKNPTIALTGISVDSVASGSSSDAVLVSFNFADGDGDLGNKASSGNFDIYTIDSRDSEKVNYFFPQKMPDVIDPTQGVEGSCFLNLEAAFILLRPTRPLRDTVRYTIYIKDRAGNESNRIVTPDIYITP